VIVLYTILPVNAKRENRKYIQDARQYVTNRPIFATIKIKKCVGVE
jgi:hypothetical protein